MHNSPTERTIFVCGIGYTRRLELDRVRLDKLVVGGRRRESAGRQPWGKAHLTARVKEAQQSFSEGQAKLRALPLRICLVFPDFRSGTMLAPQQPVHGLQAEFTLPLAARLEGERPVVYSVAQLYLNLPSTQSRGIDSPVAIRRGDGAQMKWGRDSRCSTRGNPAFQGTLVVATREPSTVSHFRTEHGTSLETL